jgi:surface protein
MTRAEGLVTASRFEKVHISLMKQIVRLLVGGEDSPEGLAEVFKSFNAFAKASTLTHEAATDMLGYVMSLASVRALPTRSILTWLPRTGFTEALIETVKAGKSSALMPRIADIAADENAGDVVTAMMWRLIASLKGATVRGEPMYGSDERDIEGLGVATVERMESGKKLLPVREALNENFPLAGFVRNFLNLPVKERLRHTLKYGPMCFWDVSQIDDFTYACRANFSSDLYWDTSAVRYMKETFQGNTEFNGDLSTWDVSKVTLTDGMFSGSGIVDSGIGFWDLGELRSARSMFEGARKISPKLKLSRWGLDKCTDLSSMFAGSSVTDNGIGEWKLPGDAKTASMLPDSFRGRLHKWPGHLAKSTRAVAGAPRGSFGTLATPPSDEELVTNLFAEAVRERDRGTGCSVQ